MCSRRTSRVVITALGGLAVLSVVACAKKPGETAPPAVATPQQAASSALDTLRALVTEQNYGALGFRSVAEVGRATLAAPLPVYELGLDRLKGYRPGQDPNSMLTPSPETIYPVAVDGQTRSSLTIVKKGSGFTASSFGNAEIVKRLAQRRGDNVAGTFVVHVPALSLYFLGNPVDNRLMLTPVVESARVPLRVGVAVPAEEVLKAILPLVQSYNGLPL